MTLSGRGAVITGGGRGIGRAVAWALAEEGAAIVVSARTTSEIEEVAAELRDAGHQATAIACNVADEASVEAMAKDARGALGTVDILVNNAGVARSEPIKRLTLDEWNRIMTITATGTFLCTRAFLQEMVERRWGRIVNVASIAGLRGAKYISAYTASKHAQIGFTRATAIEVAGTGVTANAICPGYVATSMADRAVERIVDKADVSAEEALQSIIRTNPQKRIIQSEEIAHVARMLCTPGGEGINAQTLVIDGGQTQAN